MAATEYSKSFNSRNNPGRKVLFLFYRYRKLGAVTRPGRTAGTLRQLGLWPLGSAQPLASRPLPPPPPPRARPRPRPRLQHHSRARAGRGQSRGRAAPAANPPPAGPRRSHTKGRAERAKPGPPAAGGLSPLPGTPVCPIPAPRVAAAMPGDSRAAGTHHSRPSSSEEPPGLEVTAPRGLVAARGRQRPQPRVRSPRDSWVESDPRAQPVPAAGNEGPEVEMRLQSPAAPGLLRSSGCSGAGGAPPLERRGAAPPAAAPRARLVTGAVKEAGAKLGSAPRLRVGGPVSMWRAPGSGWPVPAARRSMAEGPAQGKRPGGWRMWGGERCCRPGSSDPCGRADALRSRSAPLSPRPPELGKTGNWKEFFSGCFLSLDKNSVEKQAGRQWKEPRL